MADVCARCDRRKNDDEYLYCLDCISELSAYAQYNNASGRWHVVYRTARECPECRSRVLVNSKALARCTRVVIRCQCCGKEVEVRL